MSRAQHVFEYKTGRRIRRADSADLAAAEDSDGGRLFVGGEWRSLFTDLLTGRLVYVAEKN